MNQALFLLISIWVCLARGEIFYPKEQIQLGELKITVEVATSEEQHAHGLMDRHKLDAETGMLFVFKEEKPRVFWMKNTYIPLSIGYFDHNGRLIDIQKMQPVKSEMDQHPSTYPSHGAAMYALEMNPDWFDRHKIKVGTVLKRK